MNKSNKSNNFTRKNGGGFLKFLATGLQYYDNPGKTGKLWHAVYSNDIESVKENLKSKGLKINKAYFNPRIIDKINRTTPLMIAAYYGNKSIVELLLEHCADPSIKHKDFDTTAYDFAIKEGNTDTAKLLKDYVYDKDKCSKKNNNKNNNKNNTKNNNKNKNNNNTKNKNKNKNNTKNNNNKKTTRVISINNNNNNTNRTRKYENKFNNNNKRSSYKPTMVKR
jgi:ankyrin repeat protein